MKRFVAKLSTSVGPPLRPKITTVDVARLYRQGQKMSMIAAHSYPAAVHVDSAGIEVLLVGDSLAMVELGHDTTLPVTVDDMLYHCRAVARGAKTPLLVGDMPFGSYEDTLSLAYKNAIRFLKEANMDAVKLEGGKIRAATVKHLVDNGVAVMGHIGLTPQRISVLGGFRAQGRTVDAALKLIDDAKYLQEAGAFAIVVECVPAEVGKAISEAIEIPTFGIGAGPHCSGQVLVYHDILGLFEHAHHAKVAPQFCKAYAHIGQTIRNALKEFKVEVQSAQFPGEKYSPYKMLKKEKEDWDALIAARGSSAKSTGYAYTTIVDQHPPPAPPPPIPDTESPIKVY